MVIQLPDMTPLGPDSVVPPKDAFLVMTVGVRWLPCENRGWNKELDGRGHPAPSALCRQSPEDIPRELSERGLQSHKAALLGFSLPRLGWSRLLPASGSPSLRPGWTPLPTGAPPTGSTHCCTCLNWRRPEWQMAPLGDGLGLRKGALSVHRRKRPFSAFGVMDPFKNLVEGRDTRNWAPTSRVWQEEPGVGARAGECAAWLQVRAVPPAWPGGPVGAEAVLTAGLLPGGCWVLVRVCPASLPYVALRHLLPAP